MFTLMLAVASLGQYYQQQRVCGGYGQTYMTYQQPVYQQPVYQQPYAAFQADPNYFASQVAAYARKQVQEQAALKAQSDLVARLAAIEAKLSAPEPQPPVQLPYSQPLSSPQQPLGIPRVPDKSPPPTYGTPQTPQYQLPVPEKSPPQLGSPQQLQVPEKGQPYGMTPQQPQVPEKSDPEASYGGQPQSYGGQAPSYGVQAQSYGGQQLPMANVPLPPTVAQASAIGPVLQRNGCFECHSSARAERGIVLDDPDHVDLATRIAAYKATRRGFMPQNRPHLSPADQQALGEWVKQGALDQVSVSLR